jgi:hypothetical protein
MALQVDLKAAAATAQAALSTGGAAKTRRERG